jgi:hypothetical protein
MGLFSSITVEKPKGLFSDIPDTVNPANTPQITVPNFSVGGSSTPQFTDSSNVISNLFTGIGGAVADTVSNAGKNLTSNLKNSIDFLKSAFSEPSKTLNDTAVGVYQGVNESIDEWKARNQKFSEITKKVQDGTATDEDRTWYKNELDEMQKKANDLVMSFTTAGGGSDDIAAAIRNIAKSNNADEIGGLLKRIGVDDSLIPQASKFFTTVDDPNVIAHILNGELVPRSAGLLESTIQRGLFSEIKSGPSYIDDIAKATDNKIIKTLLEENTNINKTQLNALSDVLTTVKDPKKVETILSSFDNPKFVSSADDSALFKAAKEIDETAPKFDQAKALDDWEVNFQEKVADLDKKIMSLQDTLKVASSREKPAIQKALDNLYKESANLEDDFLAKWGDPNVANVVEDITNNLTPPKKAIKFSEEGIPLSTRKMEAKLAMREGQYRPFGGASKTPIVQGSEGEVRSLEKLAREARDISSGGEIPSGVSFGDIVSRTVTPDKAKVNLVDTYLRTPDRVMKKIGFEQESKDLRKAMDNYWKELPKNIQKITDWSKQVGPESNQRIFKWLDGQAIDLRPDEKKVAGEIKDWLKGWADRLGLREDQRVSDYITRIFDKDIVDGGFPEDIAKLIADRVPGSVYNPFTLRRLGAKGYLEDTWKALDAYVKRGTRKAYLDPVLEKIQAKAGHSLQTTKLEESQFNYIKRYVENINMRPTDFDKAIDNWIKSTRLGKKLGDRPVTATSRFLRQMTFRGMLGGNVGSALRNLSQGVNTYATLGEKYTAIGYSKLFMKGSYDELAREGVLNAGFIQDRALSSTKKVVEKLDKGLFIFFDTAEKINRGAAYFGAKAKYIKNNTRIVNGQEVWKTGASMEGAVDYAKGIVRKTQFVFDNVDTPVGMQGDIVKTFTQFQGFNVKQAEFLSELAKDKNFLGILRYIGAGALFAMTIGQAFGMKITDIIPFYQHGELFGGTFGQPPSLQVPAAIGSAALDLPDQYGNDRTTGKKIEDIVKKLPGIIPGGTQAKKTYQGYEAVKEGGSFDKAGRKQFDTPQSTLGKAQALIFGKYSTQEARDYFNKEMTAEEKAYKEAVSADTKEGKDDRKRIMPTYKKAQELVEAGNEDEARKLVNGLSEEDYAVYKKIRASEKAKETLEGKKALFPTFLEVQKLKTEGKVEEAKAIVNGFTDKEYKYYTLLKKQFEE